MEDTAKLLMALWHSGMCLEKATKNRGRPFCVERLNEHSLEDCLGRQRATAIYIVGCWVCHDFNILGFGRRGLGLRGRPTCRLTFNSPPLTLYSPALRVSAGKSGVGGGE